MNICFRVDASTEIGTGHVMRCLTLATELRKHGHDIYFICRLHEGHLCHLIKKAGFHILTLEPYDSRSLSMNNQTMHDAWLGTSQENDVKETIKAIKLIGVSFDWIIIDHYAIDSTWEQIIKSF